MTPRTRPRPPAPQPRRLAPAALALVLLAPGAALGYGYGRDDEPLLLAFRAAVQSLRDGDRAAARAQAERLGWLTDELKRAEDVAVDFGPTLLAAQAPERSEAEAIGAWVNLVYLAVMQKFHWSLTERLSDFHKARSRLDTAQAYYEVALAGNVRQDDARRREQDPRAPSRHEDIVEQLRLAREALGSPGLFGTGARAPDPEAFRRATLRIAGHLNAVFPGFVRPGRAR